jgi:cyclic-di-AMP phosphodiesterase PgpH
MNYPRFFRRKSHDLPGTFRAVQEGGVPDALWKRRSHVALALAAVLLTGVTIPPRLPEDKPRELDFESGRIAREDLQADFEFQSIDLEATREAREAAARKVPDIYEVDQARVRGQMALLADRINTLREQRDQLAEHVYEALEKAGPGQDVEAVAEQATKEYAKALQEDLDFAALQDPEMLALWLTPKMETLSGRRSVDTDESSRLRPDAADVDTAEGAFEFAYMDRLSQMATTGLEYVLTYGAISKEDRRRAAQQMGAAAAADEGQERKIQIVRDRPVAGLKDNEIVNVMRVPAPEEAQALFQAALSAGDMLDEPGAESRLVDAAYEMAEPLLTNTLKLNLAHTSGAKERAREAVADVPKTIEQNALIIARGERWTEQKRLDARKYFEEFRSSQGSGTHLFSSVAGHVLLVVLALACMVRALPLWSKDSEEGFRNLTLGLLMLCGVLVAGRAIYYFDNTGFMAPVAAGGILLVILTNVRVAAVTSFLAVVLLSLQYSYDWRLVLVSSAMTLAGVLSIVKVRRRHDMANAVFKATAVGLVAACGVLLATNSFFTASGLHRLVLVLLNGLSCLFIVPGLLPPLERLFGITTDIQLLEYSDLNNPVLSRLAIEVPATYSHSLMLGQLAEAAAEAVGANGLLARVCAYYHDIGKLRRPEYFSENQTGSNVHDALSPRLSARAIASHVLEGFEMAKEHHLPGPIIDAILEHHGTSLISFFYQQAAERQKHGDVVETDFRYPGPKPQSPETAILMICDAVESGVRSIKNPNEDRVREFVDRIIRSRSEDGQFDECDLTLRDLDIIKEVVSKRILSSLHTRVSYPDRQEEPQAQNVVSLRGAQES